MQLHKPGSASSTLTSPMVKQRLSEQRDQWRQGISIVLGMAAMMWILEVIDSLDSHRLDRDGIVPRNFSHLYGVLLAPFLHASFGHLIANTVPFLILGVAVALLCAGRILAITAIIVLVSGVGTWLTAASGSVTVGASGIVFGYATFLISRGAFDRRIADIAIGVIVGVVFGGALLSGLIPHSGISWQAHLFGGVGGVLAARTLTTDSGHASPTLA
jgi:membrane associated rhomboid family serine protease